ncbi:hypothetical protein GCM10022257_21380 [Hyunsoonleella aestuarii]|uniref:Class I SAM-dependent methyltransferase n=1 Tax=Hyunsoonleella aestuarii TaxID=912802 RepID=A0ABP8ED76_9FLAO|nr:class I SAM-dependent methyltransferase [Hyunsoonleella aestuarii]
MYKRILNIDIQEFINNNLNSDANTLILKGSPFPEVDIKSIVEQIEAKKRCEKKLPTWFSSANIYYPNKLNIEQTSSEITAKYKSHLVSGKSIIDLTGGFGVDCFYFSKQFETVTHCEINQSLSDIVTHNYEQWGVTNIQTICDDGLNFLKQNGNSFNWIYIDPSRRHDSKGKVFFLKDCLPNVPEHLDTLFEYSNNILIKTSPLLDISIGINELEHVKKIHVVSVNNEVKELLWVLEKGYSQHVSIKTVNLKSDSMDSFEFSIHEENEAIASYHAPLFYLYEPNPALLKSGGFNIVSQNLQVHKLHKHSHLYTSDNLIDFPGRRFQINDVIVYNNKSLKRLGIKKANITTRNFPETVQQIRKKSKIKDGGDVYLFFTTTLDDKKLIVMCNRIN